MMNDPLISCWIKIDRAKKHFEDLHAEVSAYKAREPYRVLFEDDADRLSKLCKVVVVEPIPEIWAGVVGDIIHNCRSSLDCLAVALVAANNHTSNSAISDTYFPIRGDVTGLTDAAATRFFGRTQAAVEDIVKSIEPYRGGKGDALWRLNRLDILDKHRAIIPVGTYLKNYAISSADILSIEISNTFPLNDGDIILRMEASGSKYLNTDIQLEFDVAFGDGQVLDGESLLPTLFQLVEFVESILLLFKKRFFEQPA